MKRKQFLVSLPLLASALSLRGEPLKADKAEERRFREPPFLVPGDLVAIAAPAGFISPEEIRPAVEKLQEWGFRVRIGETIGKRDFSLGGTDEERRKDVQLQLDDPEVKAILFARGGYGSVRIIDSLHFEKFEKSPKWLIGFSDITVVLAHVFHNCRIAGVHSKMCNSFPSDWNAAEEVQRQSILSIRDCISGKKMQYSSDPDSRNRSGSGRGRLVGGNLKTIESLAGSSSDMNIDGCILFLEDAGEYPYSIDRMFWNLKRSGKLDHLQGLIIGGFKMKPDDPGEEFGRDLYQMVLEKTSDCKYPVCFGFPVGHQKHNVALKYGAKHHLEVTASIVSLQEAN